MIKVYDNRLIYTSDRSIYSEQNFKIKNTIGL